MTSGDTAATAFRSYHFTMARGTDTDRDNGRGSRPSIALTGRELAVHLYAPVRGAHAESAYALLREIWGRWRSEVGTTDPIRAFGVPDVLAPSLRDVTGNRVVAAQEKPGPGVFQAILRREHDVICLSGMIAPPEQDDVSWTELDCLWNLVCGAVPDSLLGAARLYLAKLAPTAPQSTAVATAELAERVRVELPDAPDAGEFDDRGVTTRAGFAVWEAGSRDDARLERRVVVVAPTDRDAELSAWTWSRGDEELTPFPWYLLHAAKLRFHLRVWAGGEYLREQRHRLDEATNALDAIDRDRDRDHDGDGDGPLGERISPVEIAADRLARAASTVRSMRRSVEIAASNLATRSALAADPTLPRTLFADDRDLAAWFMQQLADDEAYLCEAVERANWICGLARSAAVARSWAAGNERSAGISLSPTDRNSLVRAMARVFPTDARARTVLDSLEFPAELIPSAGDGMPLAMWTAVLRELDNGAVADPYPRLLSAALSDYPHNPTFRQLGARLGLALPDE